MSKRIVWICFSFFTVLIESTVFTHFQVRGIIPNLSLILVVSIGLVEGSRSGRWIGLLTGFTQDCLFRPAIGMYALIYLYLGQMSGMAHKRVHRGNLLIPLLTVLASDMIYGMISYFFLYFIEGYMDLGFYLRYIILPETTYTALFVLPIYCLISWISNKLTHYRERATISHNLFHRERI